MKIVITGCLPEEVLENLAHKYALFDIFMNERSEPMAYADIKKVAKDAEALMCMLTDKIDRELIDACTRLKIIATMAVGYDNIDVAHAVQKGIIVTHTPGVLTNATADTAFALILGVMRRVVEGDAKVRDGKFPVWSPFNFLGSEVAGKTIGIVGFGRIGQAVARRALGFDMQVLYNANWQTPERDELGRFTDLTSLLWQSDIVSLHVPLSDTTRHLIGAEELALMKDTAFLINTARGPVVDEEALYNALLNKTIAGAGLDVYEHEPELYPGLAALSNTVLLPHVGSATMETRIKMADMCLEAIGDVLHGRMPKNCLNSKI